MTTLGFATSQIPAPSVPLQCSQEAQLNNPGFKTIIISGHRDVYQCLPTGKKKKRSWTSEMCFFLYLISTDMRAPGEGEPSARSAPLSTSLSLSLYLTSQSQLRCHMRLWMPLLKVQHEKNSALQASPFDFF
ncbi:uncharacterized [Tachysurus ichikawai]